MRSSRLIFATLLVVIISTTYVFVKEAGIGSRIRIANDSAQDVNITASWLEKTKHLGIVKPGSLMPITVRGEASMVFTVRYADGREMESKPVYFTPGTTINVRISEDGVDAGYDFGT